MNTINTTKTTSNVVDYTLDASKKRLGRLATEIAVLLQGKNSPAYKSVTGIPKGGKVIIKNASQIEVSGSKEQDKVYHHHTGYQGHLRKVTVSEMREKTPERIIWYAVYNMLPKNRTRSALMKRLIIEK